MMSKPDISKVQPFATERPDSVHDSSTAEENLLHTNEGIDIKSLYTDKDMQGLKHLRDFTGIAPNTRGPYRTMYVARPLTVRQYAGFSPAVDNNAFYRRNFAMGQHGLTVAFDFPTHRGYDS